MVELKKLTPSARNSEVDAATGRIIAEFDKVDLSSDAYLTGLFNQLRPVSLRLTTAVNRTTAESDLELKDDLRDSKVRAVFFAVTGYRYNPDANIRAAAESVNTVLKHYGIGIVDESYATEKSLVDSLLIDLSAEDIQAALAQLQGVNRLISDLRAAHTEFESSLLIFKEEQAANGNKEKARDVKREAVYFINKKIIVHLRAMVNMDEAKYGAFAGAVAKLIDDANLVVKKRKESEDEVQGGGTGDGGTPNPQ